jgi:hypothetical protein
MAGMKISESIVIERPAASAIQIAADLGNLRTNDQTPGL